MITQEIISIPSYKDTRGIKAYAHDFATAHGLSIRTFPSIGVDGKKDPRHPNVILGKDDLDKLPSAVLKMHVDTVPPGDRSQWDHDPFEPQITPVDGDADLSGRGATDAKGSVGAALAALVESKNRNGVVLLTALEETTFGGVNAAIEVYKDIKQKDRGGKVIIVVGNGVGENYKVGSKGMYEADVYLKSRTAHTRVPLQDDNGERLDAREAREMVIAHLKDLVGQMDEDQKLGKTRLTITGDSSGILQEDGKYVPLVNQYPNASHALMSARIGHPLFKDGREFNPRTIEEIISTRLVEEEDEKLELDRVDVRLYVPSFVSDPEKVQWFVDIIEQVTGQRPPEADLRTSGLSESGVLMQAFGPETGLIAVGAGTDGQQHVFNERTRVSRIREYATVYASALDAVS